MSRFNQYKEKATALRKSGHSYNMIYSTLGVAKSTLSNWFKNEPFKPNREALNRLRYGPIKSAQKRHNRRVDETRRLNSIGKTEIGTMSRRDLWLLGVGLYIGEGTKTYENVRIINSDPEVIRLSIRWFKEICGVKDENITVTLHLYPDNDIKQSLIFWRKITRLSTNNFRKIQIDKRDTKSKIRKNKLPFGTAHINIICNGNSDYGVKLHRRIMGWIQGVLSQS